LTTLISKEIERKMILVSKFKEDAISHTEIQELMAILEKEKYIAEEEKEEGGDGMLVFAISSLISHLSEHLKESVRNKRRAPSDNNNINSSL
jgi:hypothetical protein